MSNKNRKQQSKKEQFTRSSKSRLPLLVALLILAVAGVGGTVLMAGNSDDPAVDSPFGDPVAGSRSYVGRTVRMTPLEPVIESGRVNIPLEQLESYEMVSFEIENSEGFPVPLMAYITPSGRVFTGSSMCEPCQGRAFFLAGETLVCDTCRTTYTIESHEYLSGSLDCGSYPPVYMQPSIENGMVSIDLEDILQWRIRTY